MIQILENSLVQKQGGMKRKEHEIKTVKTCILMGESFLDYSQIRNFEADFLKKIVKVESITNAEKKFKS